MVRPPPLGVAPPAAPEASVVCRGGLGGGIAAGGVDAGGITPRMFKATVQNESLFPVARFPPGPAQSPTAPGCPSGGGGLYQTLWAGGPGGLGFLFGIWIKDCGRYGPRVP